MKQILIIISIISLFLGGCDTRTQYPENVLGYAPIYGDQSNMDNISFGGAQAYENPGKIYKFGNYSYQIDNGKGIHIINSTDPNNPQKVKFIEVPGCTEISIKNNFLYTDNYTDLIAINIADLNNMSVSSRLENVYPANEQTIPPVSGVYFECVDPDKGTVIGWTQKNLVNPKCFK